MHIRRQRNSAARIVIVLILFCTILSFLPNARGAVSKRADDAIDSLIDYGPSHSSHDPIDSQSKADDIQSIHSSQSSKINRKLRDVSSDKDEIKTQSYHVSEPSKSSSKPTTSDNTSSMGGLTTDSISPHRPLFPKSVWFIVFFLYHLRRCTKRRQPTYEVNWFVKSVDCRLDHYGVEEYERDFLSVEGSNYGSMSKWDGEESNKYDV